MLYLKFLKYCLMSCLILYQVKADENSRPKKCRALSLMGGGVKGNYETGVL